MSAADSGQARILVAEDDPSMADLVVRILEEQGHTVVLAQDGLAAIARLSERAFDLVLTDMRMPGADGSQVLRYIQDHCPQTPAVVLTAFGTIPGAVDAMRLGAVDYLPKPLPDPQALRDVVSQALGAEQRRQGDEVTIVARDPRMREVIEVARRAARSEATVLLLGPSGTGKELLARLIHESSGRSGGPFVAVNCAALSEGLLESELFGHEKGAFTGATARHSGRFEQADGGTLLLDEVGEMSPGLQAKLLRVLQERSFERVGGVATLDVDVRVIAATNRDLAAEVERGVFREDLYYRLAVVPIEVPALRERPADILPLAEHFVELLSRSPGRTAPALTSAAREALAAHAWPGNVRELQNVIERALVLGQGATIDAGDLYLPGTAERPGPAPGAAQGSLKEMERRAVIQALEAEGGNRKRAAKRLGIALRTLQYKIKEYDLK